MQCYMLGGLLCGPPPPSAVTRNWASYKIPGLDMAKTSSTSVSVLKSILCRSWQESAYTQLRNFTPSCYNHNPRIILWIAHDTTYTITNVSNHRLRNKLSHRSFKYLVSLKGSLLRDYGW